jgi:hypothetical protein
MTPKEKAEKLFNKFIIIDDLSDSTGNSLYFNAHAKQCALIAVDEILNANPNYPEFKENEGTPIRYWEVVKQEIENL